MSYEHVTVTRSDGVGRLVMDRSERNNALNRAMADELRDAVVDLVEDDAVRCIALTGTGGAFNTGADLSTLDGGEEDGARVRQIASRLHSAVSHLARAPKPVLAGVNGVAAGGGLGPALAADVVLVADAGRFEFAYPRIGLSADGSSTYYLPRLVGLRKAQEIALLDEPIDADRAVELGLATEAASADEFDDRFDELAERLANGPTKAYAATKALLRESYDRGLDEQMAVEADVIAGLTDTADYAEGVEAFFGDGNPEFVGR